jgi:hypothetical protein
MEEERRQEEQERLSERVKTFSGEGTEYPEGDPAEFEQMEDPEEENEREAAG